MHTFSRRHALFLMAIAGASAVTQSACAVEPAKTFKEVWPEIQAGKFELAAQRLQRYATEWPLDREVRSNLAIMQFASGAFETAAENLGWVVRLRRTVTRGAALRFDMDYLEAWNQVAQLRAGHAPDNLSPTVPHSLVAVLNGAQEVQSFSAAATDAYFSYLDQIEQVIGTGSSNGVTATVRMNVQRPDRDAVELSYLCIGQFMLGEQALGLGDPSAGKYMLSEVVDSGAEGNVEYHIAKAELVRLQ